jgi:hypothetical protein
LIVNDGTDPIIGRFASPSGQLLDEGATVRFGGVDAVISYVGGDGGNNVTLTVSGFRFIRTTTDTPLATLAIVAQGGGGGSELRERTNVAPILFLEATTTVSLSESTEQRPAGLEVRAAERLRVYFRVVNEATGEEEPREYELDPGILSDVLVIFKRFKFQDGRYRIYLQEPGKRERLILEVNTIDGRVVPSNLPDLDPAETPDAANPDVPPPAEPGPMSDLPAEPSAAPPVPPADEPPPAELPPRQSAMGVMPVALALAAAARRTSSETKPPPAVPGSLHAWRLRRARPR